MAVTVSVQEEVRKGLINRKQKSMFMFKYVKPAVPVSLGNSEKPAVSVLLGKYEKSAVSVSFVKCKAESKWKRKMPLERTVLMMMKIGDLE